MSIYLIVCPLVFLAGFIDSIAGGGGLVSLPAYIMTGLPVHSCIATNKMSSFMGTSVATAKYVKSGFVPWKMALAAVPCALAGSSLGANIALLIADDIFKIIMLIIIPCTAIYVLRKKEIAPAEGKESPKHVIPLCMIISFLIGIYDGFYGPGTGTFLILLLTGIVRLSLKEANGLTKAVNLSTNFAALTVFLINGQVIFPLGIIAGCFNILGNYLGASLFVQNGSKIVKPIIILVLVLFLGKVLLEVIA